MGLVTGKTKPWWTLGTFWRGERNKVALIRDHIYVIKPPQGSQKEGWAQLPGW